MNGNKKWMRIVIKYLFACIGGAYIGDITPIGGDGAHQGQRAQSAAQICKLGAQENIQPPKIERGGT